MANKYVYRHRRLDNNSIFYIGIGNKNRPHSKHHRNNDWYEITKITEYSVEILAKVSYKNALELEAFLIDHYDFLVNITKGYSPSVTPKIAKKISKSLTGRKLSEIHKVNQSKSKLNGVIFDTKTKKTYKSITDAAEKLNIKRTTLNAMLRGQNPNKTNLIIKSI